MKNKTLINVTVREGRKIIKASNYDKDTVTKLLTHVYEENVSKVMIAFSQLREGETVKFKSNGLNVTLAPLHNHIDSY